MEKEAYKLIIKEIEDYLEKIITRYDLVIDKSNTIKFEKGFVFFYQSREYMETKNPRNMAGGNAPLIYDIPSNSIHVTGTRLPINIYIKLFLKYRDFPDKFHEIKMSYIPEAWK